MRTWQLIFRDAFVSQSLCPSVPSSCHPLAVGVGLVQYARGSAPPRAHLSEGFTLRKATPMRVLMLGWEFPPFISGGLGTACHGLTRALATQKTDILFVLPQPIEADGHTHVRLLSPPPPAEGRVESRRVPRATASSEAVEEPTAATDGPLDEQGRHERVSFTSVPSWISSPYQTPRDYLERRQRLVDEGILPPEAPPAEPSTPTATATGGHPILRALRGQPDTDWNPEHGGDESGQRSHPDLFAEVHRYAETARWLTRDESFDVIHAHDWMTFPAGLAIAGATGKPLVVHVHSTEFDRAGESIDQRIYEIERRGMHAATRVICVSQLTRKLCESRYGVGHEKTRVVYNGVAPGGQRALPATTTFKRNEKLVLFLGRLTFQKGPEYFVNAAKKVLDKHDNVKFIVAGSGDLASRVIELAASLEIGHKVFFAGWLRGEDVDRVFNMADVYVMPSVSEPFGIAPLEAIRHDVPVIMSRNSGVAEVIRHALKVDFWDVDDIADKILAVLKHPPLSQTLRDHATFEVRQLTWDGAAEKCRAIYDEVVGEMVRA